MVSQKCEPFPLYLRDVIYEQPLPAQNQWANWQSEGWQIEEHCRSVAAENRFKNYKYFD